VQDGRGGGEVSGQLAMQRGKIVSRHGGVPRSEPSDAFTQTQEVDCTSTCLLALGASATNGEYICMDCLPGQKASEVVHTMATTSRHRQNHLWVGTAKQHGMVST
jgi:hypothetical protein